MPVLIYTPTGKVGRRVLEILVGRGERVTALARHPEKLAALAGKVRVVAGSIDDRAAVEAAMAGVDTVFWVSPGIVAPDFIRWVRDAARLAVEAAAKHGVKRAVMLSSVGGQVASGTGPIASLHAAEHELKAGFADFVLLRAAYFMDNHLLSVPTIAGMNTMFGILPPDLRIAQIASRDIAERAAALLADRSWTGQRILGLHGPADASFAEAAAAVSQAIGRPVAYVQIAAEQARQGMLAGGLPAYMADAYVEMMESIASGLSAQAEPRLAETTTPTTLLQFASDTMKPAIEAARAATPATRATPD